jgi:hypothetical protein
VACPGDDISGFGKGIHHDRHCQLYVALTILERIDDTDFSPTTDKEQFVHQMFGPSFDAVILGACVAPGLVQETFAAITPAAALPACQDLYPELQPHISYSVASVALPQAAGPVSVGITVYGGVLP